MLAQHQFPHPMQYQLVLLLHTMQVPSAPAPLRSPFSSFTRKTGRPIQALNRLDAARSSALEGFNSLFSLFFLGDRPVSFLGRHTSSVFLQMADVLGICTLGRIGCCGVTTTCVESQLTPFAIFKNKSEMSIMHFRKDI